MKLDDFKAKLVAVLGYGQEGKAVADYLLKHGVKPVLFDQRPWREWPKEEQQKIRNLGVNFIFGPDAFKELAGFDVVFRSPGIPLSNLGLQSRIKHQGSRIIVTSQTKFFFDSCPAKIVGVTGTKGKGTTASLIHEILIAKSRKLKTAVYLTGNIGKIQPLEFLDDLMADDIVIYELSSFQLQDLTKSPHIAVALKMFNEHLDYHKDSNEYFQAKSNIVKHQTKKDFAVINIDDRQAKKIGAFGQGKKVFYSVKGELEKGCFIKDGMVVVKGFSKSDFRFPTYYVRLVGRHNFENVCAAALASVLAGADKQAIEGGVKNFKGLSHRLELVADRKGVKFYDDSISTTPETAVAAINSFGNGLIIILGGSGKKSDFTELGKTIRNSKNIKAVILIGKEAEGIKKSIGKTEIQVFENAKNMKQVFRQIKQCASKDEIVLLSPACASFGMFKNYQDRGDQFKRLALKF